MPHEYFDTRQLARLFRCSERTITRYCRALGCKEPLPHLMFVDGRIYVRLDQVKDWARRCNPKRERMIGHSEAAEQRSHTAVAIGGNELGDEPTSPIA